MTNWKIKLGVVLIIISTIMFLFLFTIPFLQMENTIKVGLTTAIIVVGEVIFWTGSVLVGKELFGKYKSKFNPENWYKKKDKDLDQSGT